MIRISGVGLGLAAAFGATAAHAKAALPEPWQLGLMPSASERMTDITDLHNLLLWIITIITLFVLALLVWIAIRYNARANPIPSQTTHNTVLEVLWTVVPVIILVVIAIPSFRLLYFTDTIPKADLTIKAIGRQWYWTYEYPDHGNFSFDAQMLDDAKAAAAGEPRLLGTDNHVVVPVGQVVRVITTGADVIHAWALPSMGVKIDAVPGKINETWFKADREGTYYGQCSELCGARHSYMPIQVDVVSRERFAQWVAQARQKFGAADASEDSRLAAAR